MKRIILLLFLSFIFQASYIQDEQQKINAIKSNTDYLYATGVSSASGEEASDNAQDLLALEIEQWLKENKTEDIAGFVAKSKEMASQISTRRGSLYRVFAYIKKKDVLPYYKEENVMVVDFVGPQALPENSVSTDTTPSTPDRKEMVTNELPIYAPTAREKAMTEISSFVELNDFVNIGRRDGSIITVGKYSDMPKTGTIYVFIHNRSGEIPACMKVSDGTAVNLATGKEDRITDYKGCGAIWIKINTN